MPSWKDLEKFLQNDGWTLNKSISHTDRWYSKVIDGSERRTRVSKGSAEIGASLFNHILKNQIFASKTYFNKVKSKKPKSDWSRYE